MSFTDLIMKEFNGITLDEEKYEYCPVFTGANLDTYGFDPKEEDKTIDAHLMKTIEEYRSKGYNLLACKGVIGLDVKGYFIFYKSKKKDIEPTGETYYISDIHFNDQRILDLCKRPFNSLEEMNQAIINNWNNKVKDNDIVYVLGDIIKDDDESAIEFFRNLKGHKHLIIGNHDQNLLEKIKESNVFESIKDNDVIYDSTSREYVKINHYPIMNWNGFDMGGTLVYGHIHNKTSKNGPEIAELKEYYKDKEAYNCGVDVIGFIPRTLDELRELKEANKDEPYIN